jgi:hypothetical protein
MNLRKSVLLLLLSTIPALAQDCASRATLQRCLGFEDQTNATLTGWYALPPGTVAADNVVVHTGHWSVRLRRDAQSAGAFSAITRNLPVDFQGSTIELRGFLRLQDVSGNAGLWMREDASGTMLSINNMESQQVKGTRDWAEYHITLPLSPETQTLYFGVLAAGNGTVWADDLQLLVDGKPIAEAVQPALPADREFDQGSHIQMSTLTTVQIENLATLGRVWGFVKYHHPAITAGRHNWDYDLFRVLPAVLAAPDRARANDILLHWIDALGPVPACTRCVPAPDGDLDLKPALDWIHDRSTLGPALSQRLEQIYANRTGRQFYVSLVPGNGNPSFDREFPYAQIAFPDFGFQLLALFRWWNILQYWAPDRAVADQNWPDVLRDYIPKVALARDKTADERSLFELIATANDTHANLWSSLAVRPPVGECAVPALLRFIDNKPVVYRDAKEGLQDGDVIEKLDGTSVSSLIGEWNKYYADSNEPARQRDLAANLTRGACGPVSLDVTRAGKLLHISAERMKFAPGFATHDEPGATFQLLSPAVAYLKLSSIKAADLPAYFEKAKKTKALIVDIRNYPSEFVPFALGQYFAVKPTPFVSFTFADLANPGAFLFGPGPRVEPGPSHYTGRLIILVDETSQSQAEYTAMALRAMPGALVIGSTTAGADGNVSPIPLPGNLSTMISGLGIFYPDHRPTQRVGIVPDVVVHSTVAGIAAHRDEVLEIARHYIEMDAQP